MKKFNLIFSGFVLLLFPFMTRAGEDFLGPSGTGGDLGIALVSIMEFLNGVLVPFLLAIGFFVFVWGVIKYFVIGGDNDDAKSSGKSLIIYAIAGFVVILAFWGIVNIISSGIGLNDATLGATPEVIVPNTAN